MAHNCARDRSDCQQGSDRWCACIVFLSPSTSERHTCWAVTSWVRRDFVGAHTMRAATSRLLTVEPRVGVNFCDTSSAMQRKGSASMRHELFECKFEVRREFGARHVTTLPIHNNGSPLYHPAFADPSRSGGRAQLKPRRVSSCGVGFDPGLTTAKSSKSRETANQRAFNVRASNFHKAGSRYHAVTSP